MGMCQGKTNVNKRMSKSPTMSNVRSSNVAMTQLEYDKMVEEKMAHYIFTREEAEKEIYSILEAKVTHLIYTFITSFEQFQILYFVKNPPTSYYFYFFLPYYCYCYH